MKPGKEDGAILLTTILVMSLMATLAVAMFDDVRLAVKRTSHIHDYAQADWYAKGAQDFAQSYLSANYADLQSAAFNAALINSEPIIFPIEGGTITMTLRDGSQCLDINTATGGNGARQFRKLLVTLGFDPLGAANLTAALTDWIDADEQILPGGAEDYSYLNLDPPYRTANTKMQSEGELLAIRDMDAKTYALLRPFICARAPQSGGEETAAQSVININTLTPAQAPVLAALLPEDSGYNLALALISARPPEGYESIAQVQSAPALENIDTANIDFDSLATTPRYIWVEAIVNYQGARRVMAMEFDISGAAPALLSRRSGDEALRLRLDIEPERSTPNPEETP